jgi:hypothetical protein
MDTKLTSLTSDEMLTVNGGGSQALGVDWDTFWDGVLVDLQDMAAGYHDAANGR